MWGEFLHGRPGMLTRDLFAAANVVWMNFYQCEMRQLYDFCWYEIVDEFLRIYWRGGVCLPSNKPFDIGADLDHDSDLGIFNGIFTAVG